MMRINIRCGFPISTGTARAGGAPSAAAATLYFKNAGGAASARILRANGLGRGGRHEVTCGQVALRIPICPCRRLK